VTSGSRIQEGKLSSTFQLKCIEDVPPWPSVAELEPYTSNDLEGAFRARWSLPERVEAWTNSGLNVEFGYAGCRRAWMRTLLQAVTRNPQQTALDIGTGPGTIAQLWAEMGFVTFGFDSALPMVEAARRAASVKDLDITFIKGDAEDPPFAGQFFDVISSRFALYTLAHPGYALRRWVEMLRPDGRLVLIGHQRAERVEVLGHRTHPTPNEGPANPVDKRNREALRELPFLDHTPGDLRLLMEAVGLKDIERMPVDALLMARTELQMRTPSIDLPESIPFILVGRK